MYNSQLIVSNIQMFAMLLTVILYGIVFGCIQANMDLDNNQKPITMANGKEFGEPYGIVIGVLSAMVLEYMR